MRSGGLFVFLFVVNCGAVMAQSIDFNLSDESAEAAFIGPINGTGFGRSSYDISLLYSDKDADDNWMTGLGFTVAGEAGADAPGLEFGVGIKAYLLEVAKNDVVAIPLGGHIRYAPPRFSRFFAMVSLFYAPKIVTFNDGDDFLRTGVQLGYEILPQTDLYVGYRNVEVELKDGPDVTVDEAWHVGLKLTF